MLIGPFQWTRLVELEESSSDYFWSHFSKMITYWTYKKTNIRMTEFRNADVAFGIATDL